MRDTPRPSWRASDIPPPMFVAGASGFSPARPACARGSLARAGLSTHLLRATMATVEGSLDPRQFMRVHRNAIVNLSRVQQYHMPARGSMSVVLRDGARVPLSRGYQPAVRKMLEQPGHEKKSLATSPSTGHPIS